MRHQKNSKFWHTEVNVPKAVLSTWCSSCISQVALAKCLHSINFFVLKNRLKYNTCHMAIEHKQLTEMMLMNSTRVLVEAVWDRKKKKLKILSQWSQEFLHSKLWITQRRNCCSSKFKYLSFFWPHSRWFPSVVQGRTPYMASHIGMWPKDKNAWKV